MGQGLQDTELISYADNIKWILFLIIQVSWSDQHKNIPSGTYNVNVFDEEGHSDYKKVIFCAWHKDRDRHKPLRGCTQRASIR